MLHDATATKEKEGGEKYLLFDHKISKTEFVVKLILALRDFEEDECSLTFSVYLVFKPSKLLIVSNTGILVVTWLRTCQFLLKLITLNLQA